MHFILPLLLFWLQTSSCHGAWDQSQLSLTRRSRRDQNRPRGALTTLNGSSSSRCSGLLAQCQSKLASLQTSDKGWAAATSPGNMTSATSIMPSASTIMAILQQYQRQVVSPNSSAFDTNVPTPLQQLGQEAVELLGWVMPLAASWNHSRDLVVSFMDSVGRTDSLALKSLVAGHMDSPKMLTAQVQNLMRLHQQQLLPTTTKGSIQDANSVVEAIVNFLNALVSFFQDIVNKLLDFVTGDIIHKIIDLLIALLNFLDQFVDILIGLKGQISELFFQFLFFLVDIIQKVLEFIASLFPGEGADPSPLRNRLSSAPACLSDLAVCRWQTLLATVAPMMQATAQVLVSPLG